MSGQAVQAMQSSRSIRLLTITAKMPSVRASRRDSGTCNYLGDVAPFEQRFRTAVPDCLPAPAPPVRNIRLQDANDGHNIACKIDGVGAMNLKSEFVRKA